MKSILRHLAIIALCCTSLVHRSAAEEPKTLEEALLNYAWEWTNPPRPPFLLRFDANGTAVGPQSGWHWKITGPRTAVAYDPIDQNGKTHLWRAELKFDEIFSVLEGTATEGDHRGNKYTGRRMNPITAVALNANAAPAVTTHKPDQPQIRILSEESVNVTGWITSPLEVAVPEQIWENLNFLKEALKDEAAQKPAANTKAYGLANFLCAQMLRYLEERDQFTARAGGAAVLHQRSNLTQQNRDHLTWPQYMLERDERAERHENARNAPKFMDGNRLVEWNNRKTIIRRQMESAYAEFREALRHSPAAK